MKVRLNAVLVLGWAVGFCSTGSATGQSIYPQSLRVVQSQQDGRFFGCLTAESGRSPVGLAEYCFANTFMFQNHILTTEFPVGLWQMPLAGACMITPKFALEVADPVHRFVYLVDPQGRAHQAATETQLVAMIGCDGRFLDTNRLSWADNWGKVMLGVGTIVSQGPVDRSARRGNIRDFSLDNIRLEAYQKLTTPKNWGVVNWYGRPRLELDAFVLVPVRDAEHDVRYPGFPDYGMVIYRFGGTLTKPFWVARNLMLEPAVRGEMFWQNRGHEEDQLAAMFGVNWGDEGQVGINARLGYAWRSISHDVDGRLVRIPPSSQVGQHFHDRQNWFMELFISLRRPGACCSANVANN